MMPMVEPPKTVYNQTIYDVTTSQRHNVLDDTREQLYILLSYMHEGKVPPSELRGRLVNRLIHHHKLATNSEMSELFTNIRLFEDYKNHLRLPRLHEKPDVDETLPELSKKIKDTIKAYISLITKQIEV